MHIRPKFSQILKIAGKRPNKIFATTTYENGKFFTIWLQKGQVPCPGLKSVGAGWVGYLQHGNDFSNSCRRV